MNLPILNGGADSINNLLLSLNLFNSISYFSVGTEMSYNDKDQNDKYICGESVSHTVAGRCSVTAEIMSGPKGCQGRRLRGIKSELGSLPGIKNSE